MARLKAPWGYLPTIQIGADQFPDARSVFVDVPPYYQTRPLSDIVFIAIHHSGVCPSSNPISEEHTPRDLDAIYNQHVEINAWPGIAYHAIVDHWGNTFITGGAETVRYGIAGKNQMTYHICLLGDFRYYQPHPMQISATRRLVAAVQHGLGRAMPVVGHRDLADPGHGTECPGDTWSYWRLLIDPRQRIEQPGIMAYRNEMLKWLEATQRKD
jgi:hypothetical protein